MSNVERIEFHILRTLLIHFRNAGLSSRDLKEGYKGPLIDEVRAKYGTGRNSVDFDMAIQQLERGELVDTGPRVPHENDPHSAVIVIGLYSKREYVFLTEKGYLAAQKDAVPKQRPGSQQANDAPPLKTRDASYVNASRLEELRQLQSPKFDLSKLVQLCEELNSSFANGNYLSVAMLVRAVLDHVPPIFGCSTFSAVGDHYAGQRSFKEAMKNLDASSRKIGDLYLHGQVRNRESLPNETQVDFSNHIDLLLAEIHRLIR